MDGRLTAERRRLAEVVATRWNRADVGYAVVNGVDPEAMELGRDLDVCVRREEQRLARELALEVFREEGYRYRAHTTTWGHHYLFAGRDGRVVLEIDLFPDLRWGPARLVDGPHADCSAGVFRIDGWACFVKRVLVQLAAGNRDKLHAFPDRIRPRDHEREAVAAGLRRWLGDALAARVLTAASAGDVEATIALAADCRRAVLRASWRQPAGALIGTVFDWLRGEIAHAFPERCAPIVACSGADAARVSATVAALGDGLAERLALPGIRVRRLRPGWIGGPPVFVGGSALWNAVRYAGDFAVGGRLRDRRDSATLKVVLYDRCALDLREEPDRFGLRRGAGSTWPWRVSEKPDVLVRIGGDSSPSLAERSLVVELPAETPPETAAERALPAIVERFLDPDGDARC